MNSRQRVNMTLNHKEPDRVPVDFGGTIVSTITAVAYKSLLKYYGIKDKVEIIDIVQGLVEPHSKIQKLYDCDFHRIVLEPPDNWQLTIDENNCFVDEYGIKRKKASYYYDIVDSPLKDASLEDLKKFSWPDPHDPGRVRGLRGKAKKLYEETNYVIIADMISGGIFEQCLRIRGFEQFLSDMVLNKKFANALLDKILEIYLGFYEEYIKTIGDYVHIFALADDLGMQNGLLISPNLYRELIKPRHKILYDYIKNNSKAKIFHHSCGSIFPLIGDLIEVGVDILNPIQTSAVNMSPELLKREFGADITFFGGIDVQQLLPNLTPKEIKEETKRIISIMGKNGGYILAPSHNIQPDVPPENVDAMYMAAINK